MRRDICYHLLKLGKLEEAGKHYQATIHLGPTPKEAHNNLGIVRFRQGKPEQAKKLV